MFENIKSLFGIKKVREQPEPLPHRVINENGKKSQYIPPLKPTIRTRKNTDSVPIIKIKTIL